MKILPQGEVCKVEDLGYLEIKILMPSGKIDLIHLIISSEPYCFKDTSFTGSIGGNYQINFIAQENTHKARMEHIMRILYMNYKKFYEKTVFYHLL